MAKNLKIRKTKHPSQIAEIINDLGKKYQIHDLTHWNHADRLKAFLNDLKDKVTEMEYEIKPPID